VQQLVALETDPRLAVVPIDRERSLELLAVVVRCPNPVTQLRRRHPNCWLEELPLLVLRYPKQSVMVYLQAQLQLVLPMLLVLLALSPILMEQRQGFEQQALELH
jgi:hypothetical protein